MQSQSVTVMLCCGCTFDIKMSVCYAMMPFHGVHFQPLYHKFAIYAIGPHAFPTTILQCMLMIQT